MKLLGLLGLLALLGFLMLLVNIFRLARWLFRGRAWAGLGAVIAVVDMPTAFCYHILASPVQCSHWAEVVAGHFGPLHSYSGRRHSSGRRF
jgi:hypothetical protein